MEKIFYICFALAMLIVFACGDTSLEQYKPKDQNEADIIALLKKYKGAIDTDDKNELLACFHNDCKFFISTGGTIDKNELSNKLSEWLRKWNKVDISKIKIDLKENSAKVIAKEKIHFHGHETLGLNKSGLTYYDLVREENEWLILQLRSE